LTFHKRLSLAVFGVLGDAIHFLRRALAESTKKAYGRAWRRFVDWARKHKVQPLPLDGCGAANYLASLARSSGSQHVGAQFISAANFVHAALNLPPPCTGGMVAKLMQGVRADFAAPPKQSKALTQPVLKQLLLHLLGPGVDGESKEGKYAPPQAWCTAIVALVSFASSARYDDLRQLNRGQIEFLSDGDLVIRYGRTKTNRARRRDCTDRIVPSGGLFCPGRLIRLYLDKLPEEDDYPFIPTCYKSKVWKQRATNNAAIRAFRSALDAIGEPSKLYGLHSGRVGAQTALCEAGVSKEDCIWKARWAPNSRMHENYARLAPRKASSAKTSHVLSLEQGRGDV